MREQSRVDYLCVLVAGVLVFLQSLPCLAQIEWDADRAGPFLILESGRWGYMSATGEVVVPPRFQRAAAFHEGLAAVCVEDNCGFINTKGDWAIHPQFDSLGSFSEGLAVVRLKGRFVYIDRRGRIVIKEDIRGWHPFKQSLARFISPSADDLLGFISKSGAIAIEPRFDRLSDFSEGLAAARIDSPGLCREGGVGSSWGFIDRSGEMVIEPRFSDVRDFSEGLSAVQVEGKWGYIGPDGLFRIPPQYDYADSFSEGLAMVLVGELYGFIDKGGTLVIPPQFSEGVEFSEGLATVSRPDSEDALYIRRTGEVVLSFPGPVSSSAFLGEVALLVYPDYFAYVDKRGRIIWKSREPFKAPNFKYPLSE